MNIKKNIPNAITCGNLLCGCLAIVCAFNNNLVWSAKLVGIAAVLDFFDGFVARLLKVHSEIGKQLDSLADMVTFGVVPGIVMFQLINTSILFNNIHNPEADYKNTFLLSYLAFFIIIFSCIRLAKFNIDTRQSDSFIGVPTPANAILICSIPIILYYKFHFPGLKGASDLISNDYMLALDAAGNNAVVSFIMNTTFLIGLSLLMSYLLVAELPLFALKFKTFKWTENKIRYVFLISSLILLIIFQFIAIPFIILLYIVLSIINNTINKNEIQSRN